MEYKALFLRMISTLALVFSVGVFRLLHLRHLPFCSVGGGGGAVSKAQSSGVPRGGLGCSNTTTPPEILKAPQNRAKFNPIVKAVKNC